MSADMLIAACNAPVYNTPGGAGAPEIITDHELLLTRATDAVLDDLVKLIRSREDGDTSILEASLDDDQLDLFDYDHDSDAGIATQRRELALVVLKDVLSQIFEEGAPGESPTLNNEITWIRVGIGDQKRTLLITGGMSNGDDPTEAAPAVYLLDMLDLFDKPFVRPGSEPARTLDTDELYALNDQLTAQLAARGWNADTEDDFDALNDLTHAVAGKQVVINELIEAFVDTNTPPA